MNGPCFVTVIDLIELEFNDMSILVGHFMSSQRKEEERYGGKSISNQPIPFPIDRDIQDFHALFQCMF